VICQIHGLAAYSRGKEPPSGTNLTGGLVDAVAKTKTPAPVGNQTAVVQPVAQSLH